MINAGLFPGINTAEKPPRSLIASMGRYRTPDRGISSGAIHGIGVRGFAIFKNRSRDLGLGSSPRVGVRV